jgi:nucleotide-binding universal stress UspA family protein
LSGQPLLPKRILTAVDGSSESLKAARYAIELAKVTGGSVVAINIILLPQYVPDDVLKKMKQDLMSKGESTLEEARRLAGDQGVSLEGKTLETTSSVVGTICDSASRENADLIVIGTRGSGGVAKLMLGSVAGGVVKSAHCAVLVIR